VAAREVDLSVLKLPVDGADKGIVTGIVNFQAGDGGEAGADANSLTGHGTAYVEGADLRKIPVAAAVLRRAGLARSEMMAGANIEGRFQLRGLTVVLGRTRVSLPLAAIDVEPGGTFELGTGRLDVHVVVMMMEKARDVLKRIPLVGMMVDLTERFTRMRVQGKWDDSDSLVLTPMSLAGLADGSRKLLSPVARGRRLGKAAWEGLEALFKGADANSTPRP